MKRTLKRELKVLEIATREADKISGVIWFFHKAEKFCARAK